MNDTLTDLLAELHSLDRTAQTQAYFDLLRATDQPVDWVYEVWDRLVADLKHPDNHVRSIAAQVLCNLAKSDPEQRLLRDFEALLAATRDERFVTARHCLQALWKVGAAGSEQLEVYLRGLVSRFHECSLEKNCTLIRYDILQSFRRVYDFGKDETLRETALELIKTESNEKYRKKYAHLWKTA